MIPDRYCAIRPGRRECVVNGVEREGVDGPDVVDLVDRLAVGFEGVLLGLGCGGGVEVFDCYATFCGSGCVAWKKQALVYDKRRRVDEKRVGKNEWERELGSRRQHSASHEMKLVTHPGHQPYTPNSSS